jgi:hypothetical protein
MSCGARAAAKLMLLRGDGLGGFRDDGGWTLLHGLPNAGPLLLYE